MNALRLAVALLIVLAAPAVAQEPVPDTTEAWLYYPLHVGNVWEYRWLDPGRVYYERREIEHDTTIGGQTYAVETTFRASPSSPVWTFLFQQLIRFDSTGGRLAIWRPNGERFSCDNDPDFGAAFDSLIDCVDGFDNPDGSGPEETAVQGGYGGGGTVPVGSENVPVQAVKRFFGLDGGDPATYPVFAAPIGRISDEPGFCGLCRFDLKYARVDGVEYGQPIGVGSEPTVPTPTALALTAHPNPTDGALTLTLDLLRPQALTVEAFSVLGRRVHTEALGVRGAGRHTLALDATPWAPGVYVVRVTGEAGWRASVRVVRR